MSRALADTTGPKAPETFATDRELWHYAALIARGAPYPDREVVRRARPLGEASRAPNRGAPDGLSGAEVKDALSALLLGREVHLALQFLHESGLLAAWLPELEVTVDFSQEAGRRHKDVWEHTRQVVRQSVPRLEVRWAALLHDIGKVPTRTFTPDGGVHFHGHSEVGARMFDDVARRLSFERPLKQKVRFLILHHLRANQYDRGWTDSAVRRFDREMEPHLVDLLDLSRADITSKRPGKRQAALAAIHELSERIRALREQDAIEPPLPKGIGTAIMERFGLPPSRRIGEIKEALEAAIERGELEPRQEPEYYLPRVSEILAGGAAGADGARPPRGDVDDETGTARGSESP